MYTERCVHRKGCSSDSPGPRSRSPTPTDRGRGKPRKLRKLRKLGARRAADEEARELVAADPDTSPPRAHLSDEDPDPRSVWAFELDCRAQPTLGFCPLRAVLVDGDPTEWLEAHAAAAEAHAENEETTGTDAPSARARQRLDALRKRTEERRLGPIRARYDSYVTPVVPDSLVAPAGAKGLPQFVQLVGALGLELPVPELHGRCYQLLQPDCEDYVRLPAFLDRFQFKLACWWPRGPHPACVLVTLEAEHMESAAQCRYGFPDTGAELRWEVLEILREHCGTALPDKVDRALRGHLEGDRLRACGGHSLRPLPPRDRR